MNLSEELQKLSKPELIALFMNKGLFLRLEINDITKAKIDVLSPKADTLSTEALNEMDQATKSKDRKKMARSTTEMGKSRQDA